MTDTHHDDLHSLAADCIELLAGGGPEAAEIAKMLGLDLDELAPPARTAEAPDDETEADEDDEPPPEWLPAAVALAGIVGCSARYARDLAAGGAYGAEKVEGQWRIPSAALDEAELAAALDAVERRRAELEAQREPCPFCGGTGRLRPDG